jgi:two-component system OmpR family sensor kinase
MKKPSSPIANWSLRNRLVIGVLVLSAVGITTVDFAAQTALKSYLIGQADDQLIAVAGGSFLRLDRAGIEPDDNDDDNTRVAGSSTAKPLNRVPSAISVTLLTPNGFIVGNLGGELSNNHITEAISGLTAEDVKLAQGIPFTIENKNEHFRVLARLLPSGTGSAIAAISLEEIEKTLNRLRVLFFLIGFVVLLLIGLLSLAVVRLSLKPLTAVETTANAIARGDLSARLPEANPKTEVGRLIESLNSMLSKIEDAFAARKLSEDKLRRFVADASHELRTPLTAIRGFAELHRQGAMEGAEKSAEVIRRIEDESKRMGSLVEDLLSLARLDQAQPIVQVPVEINKVVNDVIAASNAIFPHQSITAISPTVEVFVLGNPEKIHQALSNLVINACTYSPDGSKIEITTQELENQILISVKDDGPGLNVDQQERVFERFYRADTSRVRHGQEGEQRQQGSGLGLSIVDAIMQAHGGRVSVKSELGKGSEFILAFPIENF